MLVLISEHFSRFAKIADRLTDRGIFLLHCPMETAEFICDKYDTGGVLLDMTDRPHKGLALFLRLRETYPEMPIAVICDKNRFPWIAFDRVIKTADPEEMECKILSFCLLNCRFYTGSVSGTDWSIFQHTVYYHGKLFSLPTRQYRLLRCLLYRAPRIMDKNELLSMCFPSEAPTFSDLSVLSHGINKRAARHGLEPLIENVYGKGYRLCEGLLK